jgi:hypothetical protein
LEQNEVLISARTISHTAVRVVHALQNVYRTTVIDKGTKQNRTIGNDA